MNKTYSFTVQYHPDSGAFLIYVAGVYYATATTGDELGQYLSLKKRPKERAEILTAKPRNQNEEAITEWLRHNEPVKLATRGAKAKAKPNEADHILTLSLEDLGL